MKIRHILVLLTISISNILLAQYTITEKDSVYTLYKKGKEQKAQVEKIQAKRMNYSNRNQDVLIDEFYIICSKKKQGLAVYKDSTLKLNWYDEISGLQNPFYPEEKNQVFYDNYVYLFNGLLKVKKANKYGLYSMRFNEIFFPIEHDSIIIDTTQSGHHLTFYNGAKQAQLGFSWVYNDSLVADNILYKDSVFNTGEIPRANCGGKWGYVFGFLDSGKYGLFEVSADFDVNTYNFNEIVPDTLGWLSNGDIPYNQIYLYKKDDKYGAFSLYPKVISCDTNLVIVETTVKPQMEGFDSLYFSSQEELEYIIGRKNDKYTVFSLVYLDTSNHLIRATDYMEMGNPYPVQNFYYQIIGDSPEEAQVLFQEVPCIYDDVFLSEDGELMLKKEDEIIHFIEKSDLNVIHH